MRPRPFPNHLSGPGGGVLARPPPASDRGPPHGLPPAAPQPCRRPRVCGLCAPRPHRSPWQAHGPKPDFPASCPPARLEKQTACGYARVPARLPGNSRLRQAECRSVYTVRHRPVLLTHGRPRAAPLAGGSWQSVQSHSAGHRPAPHPAPCTPPTAPRAPPGVTVLISARRRPQST